LFIVVNQRFGQLGLPEVICVSHLFGGNSLRLQGEIFKAVTHQLAAERGRLLFPKAAGQMACFGNP
jgi:hypothetical protein